MERRKFIQNSLSFAALLAFHKEALAQFAPPEKKAGLGKYRFPEVTLYTSKLEEQHQFYSKVLGFTIIEKTSTQFSMDIGESVMIFKEIKDGSEPFYHYAINIPTNKYKEAQKWLAKRTPLLQGPGNDGDLFYFGFWDAHAMYFKDPAGNIGEFISRHTLENDREGDFDTSHLLGISEIGTPVNNPADLASELKSEFGLEPYVESMFIGDENGMFVAVPTNRPWYPENKQIAKVHPTELVILDKGKENYKYKTYPYTIRQKK